MSENEAVFARLGKVRLVRCRRGVPKVVFVLDRHSPWNFTCSSTVMNFGQSISPWPGIR